MAALAVKPSATEVKHKRKERILHALNKLGDRDTQKSAAEELTDIATELDLEGVSTLVSCLSSSGTEQKVFARKECLRLFDVISSQTCPVHAAVLQQPLLGKALLYIKHRFKDSDTSVRDAAGDTFGALARNMALAHSWFCTGDANSNPLLKLLLECLADQKKELQAAAAHALAQVVNYTGPLAPAHVKLLTKLLNAPTFLAKAQLMTVFGCFEGESLQPSGLVQSSVDALVPLVATIVGQPVSSSLPASGLMAGLTAPDWPVRKAAADAIKAFAVALGPHMDSPHADAAFDDKVRQTFRAAQALAKCKFDKVKPVRDAAQEALAVLADLLEFMEHHSPMGDWSAFCLPRLAARIGSPRSWESPVKVAAAREPHRDALTPQRDVPRPSAESRVALAKRRMSHGGELVLERFRKAAADTDLIAEANLENKPRGAQAPLPQESAFGKDELHPRPVSAPIDRPTRPPLVVVPGNGLADDSSTPGSSAASKPPPQQRAATKPGSSSGSRRGIQDREREQRATPRGRSQDGGEGSGPPYARAATQQPHAPAEAQPAAKEMVPKQEVEALKLELLNLQEQQQRLLGLMESLATSTQDALTGMSSRVASLEAALARLATRPESAPSGEPGSGRPHSARSAQQDVPGMQPWDHGKRVSSHGSGANAAGEGAAGSGVRGSGSPTPRASQLTEAAGPSRMAPQPSRSTTPRPRNAAASSSAKIEKAAGSTPKLTVSMAGIADSVGDSGSGLTPSSGADIDTMYAEALRSPHGELRLLRLMARTGPAWGGLAPETAHAMLACLRKMLEDRTALSRILPWFWPLADEDACCVAVPQPLREGILAALVAVPEAEDVQLGGKAELLLSTLRAVWGVSPGPSQQLLIPATPMPLPAASSSPVLRPGHRERAAAARASMENLGELQAQLDVMQTHFQKLG